MYLYYVVQIKLNKAMPNMVLVLNWSDEYIDSLLDVKESETPEFIV